MHLHLDCFSGVAGDMMLGALIDLGASAEGVEAELRKLPLAGWSVAFPRREAGHGMVGTGVDVIAGVAEHVPVRRYLQIAEMIARADLAEGVARRAQAVFRRLAEAEAKVHDVPVEDVHFHEVGAVDSLVDIVGVAVALEVLGVETVSSSPVPLGHGFVETAHGRIPVPAPAALECLRSVPCFDGGLEAELVTPTGAAIVGELVTRFTRFPPMTVHKIGYGAGTRHHPDRPNVLRVVLGPGRPSMFEADDEVWELAANIDDQTPEELAHAAQALRDAGALDVWLTPIVMKKGRPGHRLASLVSPQYRGPVAAALLRHSTSLGVRMAQLARTRLERQRVEVSTAFGPIAVKVGLGPDGTIWNLAPEDDDLARAAQAHGVPVKEVRQAALAAGVRIKPEAGE